MDKYNPDSPWNPAEPVVVTPGQYEEQVVSWLRGSASSLDHFTVQHLRHLPGGGGDYEFDAVAEFTVFGGAQLIVLVECKRLGRPVEREKVLALQAKLVDVKAHKAMIFATCGFQSGAIEYATARGIALVTFVNGSFTYETKAIGPAPPPPPWLPPFVGLVVYPTDFGIGRTRIDSEDLDPLREWLNAPCPGA